MDEAGPDRKPSDSEDFPNSLESVAGDGDAAVDWRIEAKVVVARVARGERADAI